MKNREFKDKRYTSFDEEIEGKYEADNHYFARFLVASIVILGIVAVANKLITF